MAVPRDAVASESSEANGRVLDELEAVSGVDTRPAAEVPVSDPGDPGEPGNRQASKPPRPTGQRSA